MVLFAGKAKQQHKKEKYNLNIIHNIGYSLYSGGSLPRSVLATGSAVDGLAKEGNSRNVRKKVVAFNWHILYFLH